MGLYLNKLSCCSHPYNLVKIDPSTGALVWGTKIILTAFNSGGTVNNIFEMCPVPISNDFIALFYDNSGHWALARIDNTGAIVWQTVIIAGNPPTVPAPTSTLVNHSRMLYASTSSVFIVGAPTGLNNTSVYTFNVSTGAVVSNNVITGWNSIGGAAFTVTTGIGATHAAIIYATSAVIGGANSYVMYDLDSPSFLATTPATTSFDNSPVAVKTTGTPQQFAVENSSKITSKNATVASLGTTITAVTPVGNISRAIWNSATNTIAAVAGSLQLFNGSTLAVLYSITTPTGTTTYLGSTLVYADVGIEASSGDVFASMGNNMQVVATSALFQAIKFDVSGNILWTSPAMVNDPAVSSTLGASCCIVGNDNYLYMGGQLSA